MWQSVPSTSLLMTPNWDGGAKGQQQAGKRGQQEPHELQWGASAKPCSSRGTNPCASTALQKRPLGSWMDQDGHNPAVCLCGKGTNGILRSRELILPSVQLECCTQHWAPCYRRHWHARKNPVNSHKDDEGTGTSLLLGKAEKTRTVQPEKGSGGISSTYI